jgi:hypothetical protein
VTHLSHLLQRCNTSSTFTTSTSGCGGLHSPTTKVKDVCRPTEHTIIAMLAPIAGYCYPFTAPSTSASTVTTAGFANSTFNIVCVSRP